MEENKMKKLSVLCAIGLILVLFSPLNSLASLILNIDLYTQEFDWVDSTIINKTSGIDDNRFGTFTSVDAEISSPLLDYSGNGSHYSVVFDFSSDGSLIDGIGLATTLPPGNPASFSGTSQGPTSAIFTTGDFAMFANLSVGEYDLDPVAEWSGGIKLVITTISQSIPEPTTMLLFGSLLVGFLGLGHKKKFTESWRKGCGI